MVVGGSAPRTAELGFQDVRHPHPLTSRGTSSAGGGERESIPPDVGDGVTPVWILTCLFFVSVLKTGENWDREVGDCRRRARLATGKRRYLGRHHLFEERKKVFGGNNVFWGTHLSDGLWGCEGVAVMERCVPALHGLGKQLSFSSAKPWG